MPLSVGTSLKERSHGSQLQGLGCPVAIAAQMRPSWAPHAKYAAEWSGFGLTLVQPLLPRFWMGSFTLGQNPHVGVCDLFFYGSLENAWPMEETFNFTFFSSERNHKTTGSCKARLNEVCVIWPWAFGAGENGITCTGSGSHEHLNTGPHIKVLFGEKVEPSGRSASPPVRSQLEVLQSVPMSRVGDLKNPSAFLTKRD